MANFARSFPFSEPVISPIQCAAVAVTPLPPATKIHVRAAEAAVPIISAAFGVALPREACRSTMAGNSAALWLGPDEWLVMAPDNLATQLIAAASANLGDIPVSLVDVSHRSVGIGISGPRADDVLNAFVTLDLHPSAFPLGMCNRTLLGKAEIVLWRISATSFRIEVFRSFVPFVWLLLREASREYEQMTELSA